MDRVDSFVRADTSLHAGNINLMTGSERYCTTVHEIEVAQPLELVIIGNAGCVTAESDLGANIQVEFRTTLCRLALERLALSPLINQERPFCLDPDACDCSTGVGSAGCKLDRMTRSSAVMLQILSPVAGFIAVTYQDQFISATLQWRGPTL